MTLVRDVMTTDVMYVQPDTPVPEAARRMKEHDIGILPVVREEKVVGVVTDRDIVVRSVAAGGSPGHSTVDDVMSREPVFCRADEELGEAARHMKERQVRRVLVRDGDGKLAGVCSLGDVATAAPHEMGGGVLSRVSEPSSA